VDAAAAVPAVDLAVLGAEGPAAVAEALGDHAAEDRVELGLAHLEGVVPGLEGLVRVEVERERLARDADLREVAHLALVLEAEDALVEARGRLRVAGGDDRVVQLDGHRATSPGAPLRVTPSVGRSRRVEARAALAPGVVASPGQEVPRELFGEARRKGGA